MSIEQQIPASSDQNDSQEEGPSEMTLMMYSLFMAASSVIFGGLSLWHASEDDIPITKSSIIDIFLARFVKIAKNARRLASFCISLMIDIDPQTFVWLASMLCLIVLLAFATNPSDDSFRSFLTDLALREHLHHFRQEAIDSSNQSISPSDDSNGIQSLAKKEAERSLPHVQSFTNRVSVSLRTPTYHRQDFGLMSTVIVSEQDHFGTIQTRRFIGIFGKWWIGRVMQSGAAKEPAWGILNIQARNISQQQDEEDASRSPNTSINSRHEDPITIEPNAEKAALGRRRKHGNKAKSSHSPLQATMTKDASTSYDSKIAEETLAGDSTMPSSPTLNGEMELGKVDGERKQTPVDASQAEAIAEAQAQLDQVRIASESARQLLQTQLDEMRTRKKDEDATRLDVKGRMKTLDEHKRQAEGTRREAEKRLKAAKGLKELLENKIQAKSEEIVVLRKREATNQKKAEESGKRKAEKIADLNLQINKKKEEEASIDSELDALNKKLEKIQQQLQEEEGNLQAAREMASERANHHDFAPHQSHMYAASEFYGPQQPLHAYGHQYDQYGQTNLPIHGPLDAGQSTAYYDLMLQQGNPMHQNEIVRDPAQWNSNAQDLPVGPIAPQARSFAHMAAMMDNDADLGGLDDAFDPTILASGPHHHEEESLENARFSPFSYDSNRNTSAGVPMAKVDSLSRSRMSSITPISPFSSDLLPSNLFQNTDEDEKHLGLLPGTRSERIEAALNRFGLDNSDTSDVEIVQDESVEKDDKSALGRKRSSSSGGRSWWGGRQRSKERALGDALAPMSEVISVDSAGEGAKKDDIPTAEAASLRSETSEGSSAGKRRSLSIFPKLSLNPGAKSFRGSLRRNPNQQQDREGVEIDDKASVSTPKDEKMNQDTWNSSLGPFAKPQQDFDSVKRAFESDRPARLSSEISNRTSHDWDARSNAAIGARWPSQLADSIHDPMRTNSDSLTHVLRDSQKRQQFRNGIGSENPIGSARSSGVGLRPGPTDWLDDMILPLERQTSRGSQFSTHSGNALSAVRIAPATNKQSRFALWRNSSYSKDQASDQEQNQESSSPVANIQDPTSTNLIGTSQAQEKPKRASFLWSRKNDANSINE